jgi:hypothetical protein
VGIIEALVHAMPFRLFALSLATLLGCGARDANPSSDMDAGESEANAGESSDGAVESTGNPPIESDFTIEVMVGTDSAVEARYGEQLDLLLEEIELQAHYMYAKLGPDLDINFVVVRHEASVDTRGLELTDAKAELLSRWRDWATQENVDDDDDPMHFDYSVLITAVDFGGAGWGNDGLEGMCRDTAPAAIINDRGHFAAKIMVHEAGHTLTLGHVEGSPLIMNPAPGTAWDELSTDALFSYFDTLPPCLLDSRVAPAYEGVPVISREAQCQSRFSLPECPTEAAQMNCERLVCETDDGCKWDDSPPLDGTSCGQGLHCVDAACVPVG